MTEATVEAPKPAKAKPEKLVTILTEATRNEITGVITMPELRTVPASEVPDGATVLGEPGAPRESDGFLPVIDAVTRNFVWVDPGTVTSGTIRAVEGTHY